MLQRELLEFLEETGDAAFCVNQQGEIYSWNVAAKELFGYTGFEVIGKSLYTVLQGRGALGTKVLRMRLLHPARGRGALQNPQL